jgi:hypothetical protein
LGFCYHSKQNCFVVGTETGTIHCIGNDFQFTRTKLNSLNDTDVAARKIIPVEPSKVLISNDDNSLVILSIPTLEIIDVFDSI